MVLLIGTQTPRRLDINKAKSTTFNYVFSRTPAVSICGMSVTPKKNTSGREVVEETRDGNT